MVAYSSRRLFWRSLGQRIRWRARALWCHVAGHDWGPEYPWSIWHPGGEQSELILRDCYRCGQAFGEGER